ncbi:MAG TPA: dihydroxyacetone kinase subunit DhaK [Firmicutes bacterium]|nr:dihydroxyacetone kinase subunit DhaK [Bacillota bacterium]
MKKLINDPYKVVDEMLEGFVNAHPQYVKMVHPRGVIRANGPKEGKVGVVIGGGSGHKPAFIGYVGYGVADGVAVGNVFASPPPDPILAVTKAVNGGAGVLYSYGNYQGDIMNFDMAAEMAEMEGIPVETVLVTDDVASAPKDQVSRRRGIAGDFFVFKIAGAKAETMASLAEVKAAAEKANANTRTMGVALTSCTVPAAGKPIFTLAEDEMEIGLGVHGEPGVRRGKLEPADAVAEALVAHILEDMPVGSGEEVAVLVNGLGATPYMELYIMFRRVAQILKEKGIRIYRSYVGEYVTSLEMAGCSVTLMRLDDELKELLDFPADTPMFVQR